LVSRALPKAVIESPINTIEFGELPVVAVCAFAKRANKSEQIEVTKTFMK
jgi:hypothetical protein